MSASKVMELGEKTQTQTKQKHSTQGYVWLL